MSRSPVAKKRSSGEWNEEQQQSASPKPDDRERDETCRSSENKQSETGNEDEFASRSSNTSTIRSMLRRTSSSRGPVAESSLRRSRRSSSYKEAPRPPSEALDHTHAAHQSQPLDLPSPCRRGSHKKQRLCERSSPPRPPPETRGDGDSPNRDTKSTLMEPPKTVKRGIKSSSRVESPPPSLEKPETVPASDAPDQQATADDTESQKDSVAPPVAEHKKTAPSSTTATSIKGNANDADEPAEGSKPAVVVAPDFGLSGKLAAETNTVNGVVLKYAEPPEARKPKDRWRLYVFKDGKDIDMHHVDKASGYLFGRDRKARC
ncbi:hypothetical protein GGI20_000462 [Coemansia sp. BCRC 34301]|nr:hypothetical protein GGI20_000462 [Coemansia sp. BCRC 34301]